MLLCDDWQQDPQKRNRVSIIGLISNIRATGDPPYPLLYLEMCVFLVLAETRGQGKARIVCIHEETGQKVFETPERTISFGLDPLDVVGVPFRIRNCSFPQAGLYAMQFWYESEMVEERPFRLR
jgi:hypothetical protein